jgi:hypothetical protein
MLLRRPLIAVMVMAIAMAAGAPILASDESFYRGHLLPKLDRQLSHVAEIRAVSLENERLEDFALYDELAAASRMRAERGARKALKSYLLQATSLRRIFQNLKGELQPDEPRNKGAFGYGFGVAHGAARIEIRRSLRSGTVRMGVDTHGGFDLLLDHSRFTRMRLVMGYDRRERQGNFTCRFSF